MIKQHMRDPASSPPQPTYVLRGHSSQIHSVCFLRANTRLLTGDAEGWIVLWSVASKRPKAVWRAHSSSILGLGSWDNDKIISHGRDNKLNVWQLRESEEDMFSQVLPIEDALSPRKEPWLLHTLIVNTLNFCSFAKCTAHEETEGDDVGRSLLVAVPGPKDGQVLVYSLPDQKLLHSFGESKGSKTGMIMALRIFYLESILHVIVGSEDGRTTIWRRDNRSHQWQSIHTSKVHSQPVLSMDICPSYGAFLTSSADAVIARHSLDEVDGFETKTIQTKHSGQQSLTVRSDGRIFSTAGWDGRLRVYSTKSMKELAVLKWHKEGCYALDMATIDPTPAPTSDGADPAEMPTSRQLTRGIQGSVQQQRDHKAQTTHWLAAGAKDGKVSLWDIY